MDRIVLTVNGAVVYDNGDQFTVPVVTVPPSPPNPMDPPYIPPVTGPFELVYAGQHFPLMTGSSVWRVPGRTANFGISVAGGIDQTSVTIIDPAGNVAQCPPNWGGGPAQRIFIAGAGEVWAQVSVPGDYTVRVEVKQAGGQDTINLRA